MNAGSQTAPSGKSPRKLSWIFWIVFLLIAVAVAGWMASKDQALVTKSLPVFKNKVLRYHFITKDDITMKAFNVIDGSADTVGDIKDGLIGHYTLSAIDSNTPINKSQIGPKVDQILIMKTLAIAIPANSAMPIGPPVHAGDIVSVAAVPLPNKTSGLVEPPVVVFDKVLVLDVHTVENQTILILAIPSDMWLYYLAETSSATIVLSYPVG